MGNIPDWCEGDDIEIPPHSTIDPLEHGLIDKAHAAECRFKYVPIQGFSHLASIRRLDTINAGTGYRFEIKPGSSPKDAMTELWKWLENKGLVTQDEIQTIRAEEEGEWPDTPVAESSLSPRTP